ALFFCPRFNVIIAASFACIVFVILYSADLIAGSPVCNRATGRSVLYPALPVEREDQPEIQGVLGWRQTDAARSQFSASEETPIWSPRIVIAVLQPQDRIGFAIRDAIFESRGDGFDGLSG